MPGYAIFLIIFVFLVIVANAVVLIIRSGKNRSPYGRRGKKTQQEEIAAIKRDREVYRRLDIEQMRIMKYLELRTKTWEMFDEVRQRHVENDEGS